MENKIVPRESKQQLSDKNQELFEFYEVPDPVRIEKVIRFIKKYFGKVGGLNVLDCGISKGGVSDRLSKEGAYCFGIDINSRKLEGIKIIQADLNNGIPELKEKFDVIFAGEVIEHLFDDGKFIRECGNILKQEGVLVMTVPNLVSLPNRFLMLFGQLPLAAYVAAEFHYHVYTRKKLENLVKDEKFEIIKSTSSYVPLSISSKIFGIGRFFGFLGDIFPTLGNQLIIFSKKKQ